MKKSVVYIILAVLLLVIGGLVWWNLDQRQELTELVEQMAIEKEELEEEYEDLAIQFDGYQALDIKNDSLQDLLSREQQRVQDLCAAKCKIRSPQRRRIDRKDVIEFCYFVSFLAVFLLFVFAYVLYFYDNTHKNYPQGFF